MSTLSIHVFCISAVCTVAAGHRMVAEGWTLFEQTCEEVGPGELPQLLRQLKSERLLFLDLQLLSRQSQWKKRRCSSQKVAEPEASASASGINETPIMIKLGPHMYIYKCGNCDIPPKTKRAMDAHIRSAHTKKALLCSFCHFTTYNMDSLQKAWEGAQVGSSWLWSFVVIWDNVAVPIQRKLL